MTFDVVVQTRCSSRTAVCAVGVALLLQSGWACRRAATAAAPPPPDVSVLTVAPETGSARFEFVGQAAASRRGRGGAPGGRRLRPRALPPGARPPQRAPPLHRD